MDLTTNHIGEQPLTDHPFFKAMDSLSTSLNQRLANQNAIITIADMRTLPLDDQLIPPKEFLSLLSQDEQRTLRDFSYKKRRMEWISGRLAAKEAIRQLPLWQDTPPMASRLSIIADNSGRPHLHCETAQPPPASISISHSHDLAAAMVNLKGNCGIDIQKMVPKIKKVVEKFSTPTELSLFSNSGALHTLTTLWTTKEAIKKSILHDQPSLFSGICVDSVFEIASDILSLSCTVRTKLIPQQQITVFSTTLDDYIISWTGEKVHA